MSEADALYRLDPISDGGGKTNNSFKSPNKESIWFISATTRLPRNESIVRDL